MLILLMTRDEQEARFKAYDMKHFPGGWSERITGMLEVLPGECESGMVADLLWGICARLTQDTDSLARMFERSLSFIAQTDEAMQELKRQQGILRDINRKRFEEDSVLNYRMQMLGDFTHTYTR